MLRLSSILAITSLVNICAQDATPVVVNPVVPVLDGEPDLSENSATGITDNYRHRIIDDAKSIRRQIEEFNKQLKTLTDPKDIQKMKDHISSLDFEATALESIAGVNQLVERTHEEQIAYQKKSLLDEVHLLLLSANDIQLRANDESIPIDPSERLRMKNRVAELEKLALEKEISASLLGLLPQQAVDLGDTLEKKYNIFKKEYEDIKDSANEYMQKVLIETLNIMQHKVKRYVDYAKEISDQFKLELEESKKLLEEKETKLKTETSPDRKLALEKEIEDIKESIPKFENNSKYELSKFTKDVLAEMPQSNGNAHRNVSDRRALHEAMYITAVGHYERFLSTEHFPEVRKLQEATYDAQSLVPQAVYNSRNPSAPSNLPLMQPSRNSIPSSRHVIQPPQRGSRTHTPSPVNTSSIDVLSIFPPNEQVINQEKEVLDKLGMTPDKSQNIAVIFEKLGRIKQAADAVHWHLTHWDNSASVSNISDPKIRNEAMALRIIELGRQTRQLLDKELPQYLKESEMTKEQLELVAKGYEHVGSVASEWEKHPSSKTVDKEIKKEINQLAKDFTAQPNTLRKQAKKATSKPDSVNKDSLVLQNFESIQALNDQVKALESEAAKIQRNIDTNTELTSEMKETYTQQIKAINTEVEQIKQRIKQHGERERELGIHHSKGYGRNFYSMRPYYGSPAPYVPYSQPAVYSQPIMYQAVPVVQQPVYQKAYAQPVPVLMQSKQPAPPLVYSQPQPVQLVYQQPVAYQAPPQPVYSAPPVVQKAPVFQASQPMQVQAIAPVAPKKLRRRLAPETEIFSVQNTIPAGGSSSVADSSVNNVDDMNNVVQVFIYGKTTKDDLIEEAYALKRQSLLMKLLAKVLAKTENGKDVAEFKNDYANWLDDLSQAVMEKSKTLLLSDIEISENDSKERMQLKEKYLENEKTLLESAKRDEVKEYHKQMIDLWNETIKLDKKKIQKYKESVTPISQIQDTVNDLHRRLQQAATILQNQPIGHTVVRPAGQTLAPSMIVPQHAQSTGESTIACSSETPWIDCDTKKNKWQLSNDLEDLRKKQDALYAQLPSLKNKDKEAKEKEIKELNEKIEPLEKKVKSLSNPPVHPMPNTTVAKLMKDKFNLESSIETEKRLAAKEKPVGPSDNLVHKRQVERLQTELQVLNEQIKVQKEFYGKEIDRITDVANNLLQQLRNPDMRLLDNVRQQITQRVDQLLQKAEDLKKDAASV